MKMVSFGSYDKFVCLMKLLLAIYVNQTITDSVKDK